MKARIAETGQQQNFEDVIKLPGLANVESQIAIPLLLQEQLVGVFAIESSKPNAFDEFDEVLVNIVANQAASAINNARLYKAEKERVEELDRAHTILSQLNESLEAKVAERTAELSQAKDASFNATLSTDYDPSIGQVEVVPQDISRVFLNVLNNACYAIHEKAKKVGAGFSPTVWVQTKNHGERLEIRLRDNGPGIPKDAVDKIFNPFFTTKPTGEGTGLGLSISYDIIVQGHQGEIRVETEEGSYTEFIIVLPRHE